MKAMKKLVAAFTLFCFSFCFIPNQARAAVPLALLAPAALGAAVLVAGGGHLLRAGCVSGGARWLSILGQASGGSSTTPTIPSTRLPVGLVYGKLADAAIDG
jgi:hypothetical protein